MSKKNETKANKPEPIEGTVEMEVIGEEREVCT